MANTMTAVERAVALFELNDCERRVEELKLRIGEIPTEDPIPERSKISDAEQPRAEARIDALEMRCQELLEQLWPIGDRGKE
jgi:hypothetical protein